MKSFTRTSQVAAVRLIYTLALWKRQEHSCDCQVFPMPFPKGDPEWPPAPCPPIAPRAGARFFLEIWADNREPRTTSLVGHHSEPRSNNVVPTHEGPQLAQPRAEALLVSCAHF